MKIRKEHRIMGTRKLYDLLQPFMLGHSIKMGRDALFDLLAANQLLVKKRKRKIQTTYSNHWLRKYPLSLGSWHTKQSCSWQTKQFSIHLRETGYLKSQIHPHLFHKISRMNNDIPNNLWQDSTYR